MNTGGQSYVNKAVNLVISILYLYCTQLSFITGPLWCDPAHLPLEAYVEPCGSVRAGVRSIRKATALLGMVFKSRAGSGEFQILVVE